MLAQNYKKIAYVRLNSKAVLFLQEQPTDELPFHLYWNAWRNDRSSWMLEDRIRGRSDRGSEIERQDWGWIEVDAMRLAGADGGTVALETRFESPDDGNPEDRTVLVVRLPAPVEPGETVIIEADWRARVPRTFARTGVVPEVKLKNVPSPEKQSNSVPVQLSNNTL